MKQPSEAANVLLLDAVRKMYTGYGSYVRNGASPLCFKAIAGCNVMATSDTL